MKNVKSTTELGSARGIEGRNSEPIIGLPIGKAEVMLRRLQHSVSQDQLQYIADYKYFFLRQRLPVISVDAKGRVAINTWGSKSRRKNHLRIRIAIPYGILDIRQGIAFVSVGTSHDTPTFAASAIRKWWLIKGRKEYARRKQLLIHADSGGSNSSRSWVWKKKLQDLADEHDLVITVNHYPRGLSRFNPIESQVFRNLDMPPGKQFSSFRQLKDRWKASGSLPRERFHVHFDRSIYHTGESIPPHQARTLNIFFHLRHPNWNYTIYPKRTLGRFKYRIDERPNHMEGEARSGEQSQTVPSSIKEMRQSDAQ